MNAKKLALEIVVGLSLMSVASGGGGEELERMRNILTKCRNREAPTLLDELRAYAGIHGLSDAEMAERLVELVQAELDTPADSEPVPGGKTAMMALGFFGGEVESSFARKVMREAKDVRLRHVALIAGLRMTPENWEEWLREALADERFGTLDRFVACEEVFRIGREGDEKTRRRVVEVFEEMKTRGVSDANRRHLDEWSAELEKLP